MAVGGWVGRWQWAGGWVLSCLWLIADGLAGSAVQTCGCCQPIPVLLPLPAAAWRCLPGAACRWVQVKVKAAQKFLGKGHRIKLSLQFRGREMEFQQIGREMFEVRCAGAAACSCGWPSGWVGGRAGGWSGRVEWVA